MPICLSLSLSAYVYMSQGSGPRPPPPPHVRGMGDTPSGGPGCVPPPSPLWGGWMGGGVFLFPDTHTRSFLKLLLYLCALLGFFDPWHVFLSHFEISGRVFCMLLRGLIFVFICLAFLKRQGPLRRAKNHDMCSTIFNFQGFAIF